MCGDEVSKVRVHGSRSRKHRIQSQYSPLGVEPLGSVFHVVHHPALLQPLALVVRARASAGEVGVLGQRLEHREHGVTDPLQHVHHGVSL